MTDEQFHLLEEKFYNMKNLEREEAELTFALQDLQEDEESTNPTIKIRSSVFNIDNKEAIEIIESIIHDKRGKLLCVNTHIKDVKY